MPSFTFYNPGKDHFPERTSLGGGFLQNDLQRPFSKEPSDSEVTDAMAKVDKVIFARRADHLQWSHMWDVAARSTTFRMFIRNVGVLRARGLEC